MPFTLTMLGTDTVFTPEPQKQPKVDYPRGETLSVVASLIAGEAIRDDKAVSPYVSRHVEVVIGPTTTGKEVARRIRCGVLAILKAMNRGETVINLVAHSRGSVEAILIAHEVNNIQAKYREAQQAEKPVPNLVDVLSVLAQEELAQPKGNTGKVQQILAKMPEIKEFNEAFNDSITKAHINLFAIEPVPGDDPLYGWADKRYCQIPEIVTDCEIYLFENERTRFFTPLQLEPSPNTGARYSLLSVPGHHGSGLSGNNRDQATVLVPENKGETSHVQELIFFKIMAFLGKHGVEFKKPEDWVVIEGSLLGKVVDELEKLDKKVNSEMPWGEELVLPICFRLYSDILQNIEAYQHFNATNYPSLGRAADFRYILNKEKIYKKLSDVLPQSPGYVNSEHQTISEKILFKILGITDFSDASSLHALVNQATDVLAQGIEAYYCIKKNSPIFRNNPVARLLINAEGKKQVVESFGVLVDKISQTYVYTPVESEQQAALFASVQKFFVKFGDLSESLKKDLGVDQEKPLLDLINIILARVRQGITSTLMLQYQGLLDEVVRLRKRFNSMGEEPGLRLDNFKLTCQRLDDFRLGLGIFRQFEPDINFDEITEHLEELEWTLLHKAADFMAGKDKLLQDINGDKFDHYIQRLTVLHGADDPVKLDNQQTIAALNHELSQMKDKLAEMQKKLEQAEMLVNEQPKKVYGLENQYQQKLTFWQPHDKTTPDGPQGGKEMVITV